MLASSVKKLKVGIVAGEASGDLLGANLINALRKRVPDIEVEGVAGPQMIAAGCKPLYDMECLSVMGFIEPLKRLPELIKLRSNLFQHFSKHQPDVFIGVDAPDFNLGLERKLRQAGISTVHYVSPSVWAWRQYRVRKIAKSVDKMLTLFPFERKFYEKHEVPAHYVGHPLAERIPLEPDTAAAKRSLGLEPEKHYIALLPGSRKQEIDYLAEPYLLAAKQLMQQHPELEFITSQVNEARYQQFHAAWKKLAPEVPITFFEKRSHDVMAAADIVIVTSGTATLEVMLYKKPMIIAYRMPWMIYQLAKRIVKTPYVGLPNVLAEKFIVSELIQEDANPDAIAKQVNDYLKHPEKVRELVQTFTELHQTLRCNAAEQAAEAVLEMIDKN